MSTLPLVSVSIISYNSAEFIVETLDSVKNQSYPNIELIVSDDKSTDNTVEIVKKWISNNNARFTQCKIIEADQNTGPAGNANRAFSVTSGAWVKLLAADDILMPNFVEINMDFIKNHPDVRVTFSRVKAFGVESLRQFYEENCYYGFFMLSDREKYLCTLIHNKVTGLGFFISKETFESLGGYNEDIPFIEDWPFWIKLFYNRIPVSFINEQIVLYRTHQSLVFGGSEKYRNSFLGARKYSMQYQMNENVVFRMFAKLHDLQRNTSDWKCHYLYALLKRLNPYHYYYQLIEWKMKKYSRALDKAFVKGEKLER